jgi:hypothetical protein
MMTRTPRKFTPQVAARARVPLLVGIMSPSGGGKTYSALRLAVGIARVFPGEIYLIDTESRRALHYADKFKFMHVPFEPPFGSLDYLEAIQFVAAKNPSVIIVDSMTHEHVGENGYLETAEKVVDRIAGDDYKKRDKAKFAGFANAAPLRTKMIEGIKQLGGNFIFCWRAKEKVKPVLTDGKLSPVEMGMMPIGGEEWIYEMAVNLMLPPRSDGVPQWRADHVGEKLMMKLPNYLQHCFEEGKPLDEKTGECLALWAKGADAAARSEPATVDAADRGPAADAGAGHPPPTSGPDDVFTQVWDELLQAAGLGMKELERVWISAHPRYQNKFKDRLLELKEIARGAEQEKTA